MREDLTWVKLLDSSGDCEHLILKLLEEHGRREIFRIVTERVCDHGPNEEHSCRQKGRRVKSSLPRHGIAQPPPSFLCS